MTKLIPNDDFQGMCLVALSGNVTITVFDTLPPTVKEAIRNSSFNLCRACVVDAANQLANDRLENYPLLNDYHSAIKAFETSLMCQEVK